MKKNEISRKLLHEKIQDQKIRILMLEVEIQDERKMLNYLNVVKYNSDIVHDIYYYKYHCGKLYGIDKDHEHRIWDGDIK